MDLELVSQCPACGGQTFQNYLDCTDFTTSQETFSIQRCPNCSLLLTNPRPKHEQIHKYYLSDDYISHTGSTRNLTEQLYVLARAYTLRWKAHLINKRADRGTLLDFGCGTGDFLSTMQQSGWTVSGIEPSENARGTARKKLPQQTLIAPTLANFPASRLDVITLWHVLEHLHKPNETLAKLRQILKTDGLIIVAVPNHESLDAKHYKENWAAYDLPRHLWHFSQKSMATLLQRNHLKITEVIPMKLDAYYVSLLSEKYANQGQPTFGSIFNGFLNGLKSNIAARRTKSYSSLIYIAQNA